MLLYSPVGENEVLLDIVLSDDSYCHRGVCEDNTLTLRYSLAEHVELPVGTWCEFEGERYALEYSAGFKMEHSRLFDYTLTMHSPQKRLERFILYNTDTKNVATGELDGRTSYTLTDKPAQHLKHIVKTMNARDNSCRWVIDEEDYNDERIAEKTIQYEHITCAEALKLIASTYETEWEIYRRFNNEAGIWEQVIALRHIVYNGDSPLSLSYGRGNGIKGGVTRRNFEDKLPLGRLYVQGGERNIDPEKYKNKALLLPDYFDPIGFDGEYLDNEEGYDETKAKKYRIDMGRQSVVLKNMPKNYSEQMIDCTDIYPQRIGTVTKVIYSKVGETENYDIIDMTIPDALNYSSYKIDKIHIVFQSGMLAGKDFDVRLYTHTTRDIVTSELKKERRFQLVKEEIDGIYMPNRDSGYVPKVGDKYIVLGINTPDAYICDNDSRTGASWEMLRKALKYFHENAKPKFTFKGELDRLWVCENRELAREKIRVGGIISFTDENFQKYPVLIRITSVKQNLNTLDDIEIELSNETWRRDKYLTFNSQGQITNFAPTSSLYQTQSTAVRLNRRQAQLLRDVQKEIEKLSEKVDVLNGLLNVPTEEPTDDPTEGSEYEPIIDPTGGLIETTFP